jgi:hypothetical protein
MTFYHALGGTRDCWGGRWARRSAPAVLSWRRDDRRRPPPSTAAPAGLRAGRRRRKAAAQGNADAQNFLGRWYANGQGVPQNTRRPPCCSARPRTRGIDAGESGEGFTQQRGLRGSRRPIRRFCALGVVCPCPAHAPRLTNQPRIVIGWIPTRSATPSTALVPQRKVRFPIPNPRLLLGFQGTKMARREGISSPFSDAGGCTSRRNSGSSNRRHHYSWVGNITGGLARRRSGCSMSYYPL